MKILNLLQRLVVVSCIALLGFYCPMSLADKRPIITLSVGSPFWAGMNGTASAYIIKVFANGHVEYNGLNAMDVMGKREYQMDKATLKALLKKIEKESSFLIKKEQERGFPSLMNIRYTRISPNIGVRVRLGQKEVTFVGEDTGVLQMEIIGATKAEQWGTENAAVYLNRD